MNMKTLDLVCLLGCEISSDVLMNIKSAYFNNNDHNGFISMTDNGILIPGTNIYLLTIKIRTVNKVVKCRSFLTLKHEIMHVFPPYKGQIMDILKIDNLSNPDSKIVEMAKEFKSPDPTLRFYMVPKFTF